MEPQVWLKSTTSLLNQQTKTFSSSTSTKPFLDRQLNNSEWIRTLRYLKSCSIKWLTEFSNTDLASTNWESTLKLLWSWSTTGYTMAHCSSAAAAKRCSWCLTPDQKSLLSRPSTVRKSMRSFATRGSMITTLQIVISRAPCFKMNARTTRVRFGSEELGRMISSAWRRTITVLTPSSF